MKNLKIPPMVGAIGFWTGGLGDLWGDHRDRRSLTQHGEYLDHPRGGSAGGVWGAGLAVFPLLWLYQRAGDSAILHRAGDIDDATVIALLVEKSLRDVRLDPGTWITVWADLPGYVPGGYAAQAQAGWISKQV